MRYLNCLTRCLALASLALVACADDAPEEGDADLGAPDMTPDLSQPDPCQGVACGDGGRCEVEAGAAVCVCDEGFVVQGSRCVAAPAAPQLDNLPAEESGAVGQPDSFQLLVSDADGDALRYAIDDAACGFEVSADASGRLSWTCPDVEAACEVGVTVSDPGGLSASGALRIACVNGLPRFGSSAPTLAREGAELRYEISCEDPDGAPVTLSVAPDHTCGGALVGLSYVWTPDEEQGGLSCLFHILCSDGRAQESQSAMLRVEEDNQPPSVNSLPASVSALWGRQGALALSATDADLPAQGLTFMLVQTTCSFPVNVAVNGQLSFACGQDVGPCTAEVSVNDGALSATGSLTIECFNNPPAVADVAISPASIAQAGEELTCGYTFSDPDGDQDLSTIEWLVAGVAVATGPNFSNYLPGDVVACRVTPNDGLSDGLALTSATLKAPDQLAVASGVYHTCALKNGALYCWGDNDVGQLGDGTTTSRATPVAVSGMGAGVSALALGDLHTCALKNGALYCWGYNNSGQLGDGTTIYRTTPVAVSGMGAGVSALALGAEHTCAIQSGALYCWGHNFFGQLGVGTTNYHNTPAAVSGMGANVSAVALGDLHTCAIQSGALYCWGQNSSGQIGDGATTNRSQPVAVSGMGANVSAVALGTEHSCAIQGGALYCWGQNAQGQLGDGTTTQRSQPVAVSGLGAGASAVSLGGQHTCAILNDGVTCWGRNDAGQLGDGATTNRATPAAVSGLSAGVEALALGWRHSCALQGAALLCWGRNREGQLGDATTDDRLTPTQITLP